jgi:cyclic pyranopterin phosphate synthase
LVEQLGRLGLEDLSMTTNGHLLPSLAGPLRRAGLKRVNVSCDAIDPAVFRAMTRNGDVNVVLAGIDAAGRAGLAPIKVNAVMRAGTNDDEVIPLVEYFGRIPGVEVRFIEEMPFRVMTRRHLSAAAIREILSQRYTLTPLGRGPGGPSVAFRVEQTQQVIGFISPITEHFCETCNRLRLEADGHLRTCLSRDDTPSLRDLMRAGIDDAELARVIRGMVWQKVAGHEADVLGAKAFEGVMTAIGG